MKLFWGVLMDYDYLFVTRNLRGKRYSKHMKEELKQLNRAQKQTLEYVKFLYLIKMV